MLNPQPPTMSALRFWCYTLGLLIVWSVVIASATPASITTEPTAMEPFNDIKNEERHTRNCKALCEHCGCRGFYCGEECICECHKQSGDTECIQVMQSNAQKLDIPFQLMIQGPQSSRFVQNAQHFDQSSANVIEQPRMPATVKNGSAAGAPNELAVHNEKVTGHKVAKSGAREKRSVPQLDWFSDFASSLVRPAPIRTQKRAQEVKEVEEAPIKQEKRSSDQKDRLWFNDNSNLLVRPAPRFNRQNLADNEEKGDTDEYGDQPYKLSQLFKDTIRSLHGNDVRNDISEAMRPRAKHPHPRNYGESMHKSDILPISHPENPINIAFQPKQSMRQGLMSGRMEKPIQYVTDKTPSKLPLPWFRPVRFLQRVQEAIN